MPNVYERCQACHKRHPAQENPFYCWLAENDRNYQKLWGNPETGPEKRPPVPSELISNPNFPPDKGIVREVRCIHLGPRIEMRSGCNGFYCRHHCDLGLPAVPGGYCQRCDKYEGDFNEDGVTGPNWIS